MEGKRPDFAESKLEVGPGKLRIHTCYIHYKGNLYRQLVAWFLFYLEGRGWGGGGGVGGGGGGPLHHDAEEM